MKNFKTQKFENYTLSNADVSGHESYNVFYFANKSEGYQEKLTQSSFLVRNSATVDLCLVSSSYENKLKGCVNDCMFDI